MTRAPADAFRLRTVAISSFSILPTGMPVQPEITSPTICASTQTRISGVSPCNRVQLGVRAVRAECAGQSPPRRRGAGSRSAGRAVSVASALRTATGAPFASSLDADFANARHQVALLLPAFAATLPGVLRSLARCSAISARRSAVIRRPRRLRAPAPAPAPRDRRAAAWRLRSRAGLRSGRAPAARTPYRER